MYNPYANPYAAWAQYGYTPQQIQAIQQQQQAQMLAAQARLAQQQAQQQAKAKSPEPEEEPEEPAKEAPVAAPQPPAGVAFESELIGLKEGDSIQIRWLVFDDEKGKEEAIWWPAKVEGPAGDKDKDNQPWPGEGPVCSIMYQQYEDFDAEQAAVRFVAAHVLVDMRSPSDKLYWRKEGDAWNDPHDATEDELAAKAKAAEEMLKQAADMLKNDKKRKLEDFDPEKKNFAIQDLLHAVVKDDGKPNDVDEELQLLPEALQPEALKGVRDMMVSLIEIIPSDKQNTLNAEQLRACARTYLADFKAKRRRVE